VLPANTGSYPAAVGSLPAVPPSQASAGSHTVGAPPDRPSPLPEPGEAAQVFARPGETAHVITPTGLPERSPIRSGERLHRAPAGLITWVFEPESFAPAAKLLGEQRYSIVTDYLGAPVAMFDAAGDKVWAADISVYGELRNLEGRRDACPFRWPGQYEDVETGLYYNRFRYYDPGAGEYVSQDPIGIASGLGLHAYVCDPFRWVDPFGLAKTCKNAQQELRAIGPLKGRSAADIERDLRKRGFKSTPAKSGGTVWTKPMPKGQTAVVRIDPAMPSTPKKFADEVPHAHKEIVPTSAVNQRGNFDQSRATKLDDAGAKTTDPTRTHIPIS